MPSPTPCHARRERFTHRTLQLLGVAALTGLFTGTRGGIFTVANTRLNVRLRKALFHSLLRCVCTAGCPTALCCGRSSNR